MKFIDTFNEDDKKRLTKKAKLIYSVLKKGTITRSDGVKFSYELGDNMVPSVVDGEIYLFAFITKIIERTYCPINEIAMSDLIMKKFDQFDIKVDLQIPKSIEIVKYKGKKPWEEQIDLNENHDDYKQKQIKKGKTVYKALRKGTIGSNDPNEPHFSYELPDDFSVYTINVGIIISLNKIKIKELNRGCNLVSNADYMGNSIRKRFSHFGIVLTSSYGDRYFEYDIEPWERPLNEEKDNNLTIKDRKKIELIYKLFKRGKYTENDILYNYVLPDEYWTSNDDETGELIVVLTMDPTQKMKLYAKMRKEDGNLYHREVPVQATQYASLYDDAKRRIKEKFERFNIEIVF
jgi:hypothetical protein